METVGLREANLHFAACIKKVRSGAEIILTDRGVPVAVIKPLTATLSSVEEKLTALESIGMIHRAAKPFSLPHPVACSGVTIADTVAELRRERG
jgi:prevent-host-death family protein